MANSLGNGFSRQTYQGVSGVHHAIFPLSLVAGWTAGSEPTLNNKGGSTQLAVTALTDFLTIWKALLGDDTVIGLNEIYAVDADTGEQSFVYGFNAGMVGSSAGDTVALSQITFSFKTQIGGLLKLVQMDSTFPVNQKHFAPFAAGAAVDDLVDYMVSDDAVIVGRDNEFAFAPIAFTVKTSDALREREGL